MHFAGPILATLTLHLIVGCSAAPPAADSEEFDWSIGQWSGTREAGSDGLREPIRLRVSAWPGGPVLLRALEVGSGENAYRGFAALRPRANGVWSWRYTNGPDREPAHYVCDAPGTHSVWTPIRERQGPVQVRRRMQEHLTLDGTWTRTMQTSRDDGATWQVLFTDRLRRDATQGPAPTPTANQTQ